MNIMANMITHIGYSENIMKGLTLIEGLIIVAIIGILVAILIPQLSRLIGG